MEERKQGLTKILKQLEGDWDLARGFLIIVENTEDDEVIEGLIKLIHRGIRTIKNNRLRAKLEERVKELQRKGDIDQESGREEADNLLNDFIKE